MVSQTVSVVRATLRRERLFKGHQLETAEQRVPLTDGSNLLIDFSGRILRDSKPNLGQRVLRLQKTYDVLKAPRIQDA